MRQKQALFAFVLFLLSLPAAAQDKLLTVDQIYSPDRSVRVDFAGTPPNPRWLRDGKHYLVSKVAPIRLRGLMMGGWFVATAMGNKLTQIGVFWDRWLHSTFFLVLGLMALVMAVVLFLLLKPLKKAMPGV